MALKAKLDSLDELEESQRSLYKQAGDGDFYVLDVEGSDGWDLENVKGLRTAFEQEKNRRSKANRKLEQFVDGEGRSLDPETVVNQLGELIELKQQLGENKDVNVDELVNKRVEAFKSQQEKRFAKEIETRDAMVSELDSEIERLLVDNSLIQKITERGGVPELLLSPLKTHKSGRPQIRVSKGDDGRRRVEILDYSDGEAFPRLDQQGKPFTLEQLVEEYAESDTYGRAFDGSPNGGSGSRPAGTAPSTGSARSRADFHDAAAKAAFIRKHGLDAFKRLPQG